MHTCEYISQFVFLPMLKSTLAFSADLPIFLRSFHLPSRQDFRNSSKRKYNMALKAAHASDVPIFDHAPLSHIAFPSDNVPKKLMVVGHRGSGMNMLQSTDQRRRALKENTISSFNSASRFPIDFVEFDVQVTKDNIPIIFHDDFILTENNGKASETRVTDLTLSEFLSYGPQRGGIKEAKPLLRNTNEGNVVKWDVEEDDYLCTLQEAFELVEPSLGFNIELKFDDRVTYSNQDLQRVLQATLQVVSDFARERPIFFSSFNPDAALLVRKMQCSYPVFFLTDGGTEIYTDKRRNSLEEAVQVCLEGELQGIVSEVRGVVRHPEAVKNMKDCNLALFTYGHLNNVKEVVYMQYVMGVDGVIVDLLEEVTSAVQKFRQPPNRGEDREWSPPSFSHKDVQFLLKLIQELVIN